MPIPYDEVFLTFTQTNLLPKADRIVFVSGVDRTITAECFLALAYTYFGAKHHERNITQRGLQKYGRALKTVNGALTDHNAALSFDVLEAITIMAVIEVS
jgi:long-subunit fatty acid transport protein